jgi:N-6 DNA Methylase/Eco57I restriction-modification methylase
MDLPRSLRSIQSLADVPPLVAELSHQPAWEAVPEEAWNRRGARAFKLWVVGQTGELPWFGLESRAPECDAVSLARRISRRGKVALVLALDPHAGRLCIAVAFDRCPAVELELASPPSEALASLSRLAGSPEGGALAFAARAAEAFSAEPVGRRFFREFRGTLRRMAEGICGSSDQDEDDRHAVVLLQLTRVLFLYFIQAKGWLGGRERFMAEEVDRCLSRGRQIQRDLLKPLFFGTLNQPREVRSRSALRFGLIPFLNGGLFEPHPLERQYRSDIPNRLWREAFDGLFERFHFTIAEGQPSGSVAPDMLGRVFEGVMTPDARRASGTFYTPASLVDRLLDAALIALLRDRLGCANVEADRRLRDPDPDVVRVLSQVTLLDPAAGSGAFLVRALDRLSAFGAPGCNTAVRKRMVLQRNLFGVDRNAAAVRLTELRLWLAVVADDPADHPDQVSPLPNLDCLIRQGDSLFDPVGLDRAGGILGAETTAELSRLRQEVIGAAGAHKRSLVRRLRQLEARAVTHSLAAAERGHQSAVAECLQQARSRDLFGQRRGLDRELCVRLDGLRHALRGLRQAKRQVAREGEVPWFHYQSHFADVFARGGFDIVIGNPPWLRSESIPPRLRRLLTGRYRWWRLKRQTYGHSPDLAVAFVERGLELCRPHGIVAMLVPAKIATAGYGAAARHALASSTTLHVVADLTGTREATFDATVYPLAIVAANASPDPQHLVRTALAPPTELGVRQSELAGGGPWILAGSSVHGVVTALEHEHPPLGHTITCHLGVKTGLNRVFLNPPPDLEVEALRWAVRGRDIQAFHCRSRLKLLWTHDNGGHPAQRLPPRVTAYLKTHEAALRARRDLSSSFWWAVFRARPAVARHRVVWSDVARRLTAAALSSRYDWKFIPLNSCYLAPVSSAVRAYALAAWLNSSWVRAVARAAAVPASGGFARFNAQVVERLPFPSSAVTDRALARLARRGRSGAVVQAELDAVTARHLNLSISAQRALRTVLDGASSDCR